MVKRKKNGDKMPREMKEEEKKRNRDCREQKETMKKKEKMKRKNSVNMAKDRTGVNLCDEWSLSDHIREMQEYWREYEEKMGGL